jgi:hypothetical protein
MIERNPMIIAGSLGPFRSRQPHDIAKLPAPIHDTGRHIGHWIGFVYH